MAILIIIACMAFIPPTILAVWVFGLRPFVARNGRPRITAANWILSMWADWTTAYEIGKETGNRSTAARIFLTLWLLWFAFLGTLLLLGGG